MNKFAIILSLLLSVSAVPSYANSVNFDESKLHIKMKPIKISFPKFSIRQYETVEYNGDKIAKRDYVILGDTNLFANKNRLEFDVADEFEFVHSEYARVKAEYDKKIVDEEKRYEKCLIKSKKCKRNSIKMDDIGTYSRPVADMRVDAMRHAYVKHLLNKSPVYEKMMTEAMDMPVLEAIRYIDLTVDNNIRYSDRGSVWARTPDEAFTLGGLCRDYAFIKYIAIMELYQAKGLDYEKDIVVVTVLPDNSGLDQSDVFHVVTALKYLDKTYYLDMTKSDISKSVRVIEHNKNTPLLKRGVLWWGNLYSSFYNGPASIKENQAFD